MINTSDLATGIQERLSLESSMIPQHTTHPGANAIGKALETGRLMICCGPGGVGKTTAAAALGLHAALAGRKVLVMTIDPARRLADALGLQSSMLAGQPQEICLDALAPKEEHNEEGQLWAMMLDARQTFEALIHNLTPDPDTAARVIGNRAYRATTHAMTGIQHYMAVGKLFELHQSGGFDLIIVDTPPTRHALDFLDAPGLISRFFDRRVLRWFTPPKAKAGFFGRLLNPSQLVFSLLSRTLGERFARDLGDFFSDAQFVIDPFKVRGEQVGFLLRDAGTAFLIITGPDPRRIREALYLNNKLREFDQEATAFVVNRVSPSVAQEAEPLETLDSLSPEAFEETVRALGLDEESETLRSLFAQLERYHRDLSHVAERDRQAIQKLISAVGERLTRLVPQLDDDVHNLNQLQNLAHHLV